MNVAKLDAFYQVTVLRECRPQQGVELVAHLLLRYALGLACDRVQVSDLVLPESIFGRVQLVFVHLKKAFVVCCLLIHHYCRDLAVVARGCSLRGLSERGC